MLKSKQTRMRAIFTHVIYTHVPNTTCPFGDHHYDFMASGALRHTHVRLHVPNIQESKEVLKLPLETEAS